MTSKRKVTVLCEMAEMPLDRLIILDCRDYGPSRIIFWIWAVNKWPLFGCWYQDMLQGKNNLLELDLRKSLIEMALSIFPPIQKK